MTKHYCDKCGKEIKLFKSYNIIISSEGYGRNYQCCFGCLCIINKTLDEQS